MGLAKLSVARLSGGVLHQLFCRVNTPALIGLVVMQLKGASPRFLPFELQAVVTGLYAAVALGVTKISRPGNDRFPDRYLEHLGPVRLHLV